MNNHPEHVIALSIVRAKRRGLFASPICAFGAFEVTYDANHGARFRARHFDYGHPPYSNLDTLMAMAEMRTLIGKHTHVICMMPDEQSDVGMTRSSSEEIERAYPLAKEKQYDSLHVIRVSDRILQLKAAKFGFSVATKYEPIDQQMRLAAERAQSIWLAWLDAYSKKANFEALNSAFKIWRFVQMMRDNSG